MPETRSLHRKLAQIMYEADRIPKNGKAPPAMGGYAFVQVGDAADYIRKALGEHVITMMPTAVQILGQAERETKAGGSMNTVDIITDWTLTDGESGESIVIQSFGAGADSGDKYSGKAQTNAMKYALLMGFLLSTGEDPELGDGQPARPATAPRPAPTARDRTATTLSKPAGDDTRLNTSGSAQGPSAPTRSGSTAAPAGSNEPPLVSDAELDSLVSANTATLRPPQARQAAERVAQKRAERVAEQPGMSLSDFMSAKGEKGIQFGADFTAACNELFPGLAWPKFEDHHRYALAVKLGMVEA